MSCVCVWGYHYVYNPRFLRHVEITLKSKWKATFNNGDSNTWFSALIKTEPNNNSNNNNNNNVNMEDPPKRRYLAAVLQCFQYL